MDARTGLGRFRNFRVSNYQLMMQLIDYCREHEVDEILNLPDVRERVELFNSHRAKAEEQIKRCSSVHGETVVLDRMSFKIVRADNRRLHLMKLTLLPVADTASGGAEV